MLKYCDESSVDYPSLVSARDEIEGVLSELNEQKRQAEDMEKLTQLAIKFKCEDVQFCENFFFLFFFVILFFKTFLILGIRNC